MYWTAKMFNSTSNVSQVIKRCLLKSWSQSASRPFSRGAILSRFKGEVDRFNGVTVDTSIESSKHTEFEGKVDDSLKNWNEEGKRCIWFKVKIQDAQLVPILANKGFNFHHAREDFVMMYKWLPRDSAANLPPAAHTNLGVGALVFSPSGDLLAVSERHYDYPHWKLPGGYVERDEHIPTAAAREVLEETGVRAEFESLVTLRHTHGMAYGNADVYVLVRMRALSERLAASRELRACRWMPVQEYLSHEHVHEWNRGAVRAALDLRARGLTLDLRRATVQWATNVRDISYLVVEQAGSD